MGDRALPRWCGAWFLILVGAAATLALPHRTIAQPLRLPPECGALENAYGPYDFTNPTHKRDNLPIVEAGHFTDDVYALRRGVTAYEPLPDIAYTLRAFPNHHLALDAMARLHRQQHAERLPGEPYSITCWFERARALNPNDGVVPLIYGIHLFQQENLDEAKAQFAEALRLMPQSPEVHYNLGLLNVRLRDYDAAREHAQKAYAMGYPLPGLREQLRRAGEWTASE